MMKWLSSLPRPTILCCLCLVSAVLPAVAARQASVPTLLCPIGQTLTGEQADDNFGTQVSSSSNGNVIAVGAAFHDGQAGLSTGIVKVYGYDALAQAWIQRGQGIEGEDVKDRIFANALSDDGTILAVGEYKSDTAAGLGSGEVRVFEFVGNRWVKRGQTIVGTLKRGWFGEAVALSGNGSILAVGAPAFAAFSSSPGQVFVYEWNNSDWIAKGSPIVGDSRDDRLGDSLALNQDGNVLVVGASERGGVSTTDRGYVRVFAFRNDAWEQIGQNLVGQYDGSEFGDSVSISSTGTKIAVGAGSANANNVSRSGQVRVYKLSEDGSSWVQLGQDLDGDSVEQDFGRSVSLSGDATLLAVGSAGAENISEGSVRVYRLVGDFWEASHHDEPGISAGDRFGASVSVSRDGSTIVAGATASGTGREGTIRAFHTSDSCSTQLDPVDTLFPAATKFPSLTPTLSPTLKPSVAPTAKLVPEPSTPLLFLNAGVDDFPYLSGTVRSALFGSKSIGVSTVPYPEDVFKTHRWGKSSSFQYTLPGFVPNQAYRLVLGFAENWSGACAVGVRIFSVRFNDRPFLTNFDIMQATGGVCYQALLRTGSVHADADGSIRIQFQSVKQNAMLSFLEIHSE